MPILSTDIKYFLSGGATNSNANQSIGGTISNVEMTHLFDDALGTEVTNGSTRYRCFYVKNTHATLGLQLAKIWIFQNTLSDDTTVAIGIGSSSLNGTETAIANDQTAPDGVTFTSPPDIANGRDLGTIPPNGTRAVWVKRILNPNAAPAYDNYTLAVQGEFDPQA